ncbi:hypothetical protein Aperf_G00000091508 [Anoplocephala perfoliata]
MPIKLRGRSKYKNTDDPGHDIASHDDAVKPSQKPKTLLWRLFSASRRSVDNASPASQPGDISSCAFEGRWFHTRLYSWTALPTSRGLSHVLRIGVFRDQAPWSPFQVLGDCLLSYVFFASHSLPGRRVSRPMGRMDTGIFSIAMIMSTGYFSFYGSSGLFCLDEHHKEGVDDDDDDLTIFPRALRNLAEVFCDFKFVPQPNGGHVPCLGPVSILMPLAFLLIRLRTTTACCIFISSLSSTTNCDIKQQQHPSNLSPGVARSRCCLLRAFIAVLPLLSAAFPS